MSMRAVIESIEREMLDRDTGEENYEMIDVSNLEDDTDNQRRYIRGRKENYEIGGIQVNSRKLKPKLEEKLEEISEILAKGNDCELRTSPNGVAVIKVKKEVISK